MEQERVLNRLQQFLREKAPLVGSPLVLPAAGVSERRTEAYFRDPQQAEQLLLHGTTFPVEVFLDVPTSVRKRRFLNDLKAGTVLVGKVLYNRQEVGLVIWLLENVTGQSRFIKDLEIQATCSTSEFENVSDHNEKINEFRAGDVVRVVVVAVDSLQEQLSVSFRRFRLPRESKCLKLGLVSEENAELILKRSEADVDVSSGFSHQLKHTAGFSNPHCIDNLLHDLGSSSKFTSLLSSIQSIQCGPNDYMDELRKQQSHAWAMETVASGVGYLKSGNTDKAEKHFDHALQIEPHNVEAYVARGALYANENRYELAMKDFQEALKQNPKHKNARKYLAETLAAQGNSRFNKGDLEGAMKTYQAALKVNPSFESAQCQLETIQNKLELQALRAAAAKAKEKEESKRASSLYKLRQLISDEEIARTSNKPHRKEKKKKAKDKKKKHRRHKKSRHSEKLRLSFTSNESPRHDRSDSDSVTSLPREGRRSRRVRSWTYSDEFSVISTRTGDQCESGNEMTSTSSPRMRIGQVSGSMRQVDSPKRRESIHRLRSRSGSSRTDLSKDDQLHQLERTSRNLQSPRRKDRYSPPSREAKRSVSPSVSRSSSSSTSFTHSVRRDRDNSRRSNSKSPLVSLSPCRPRPVPGSSSFRKRETTMRSLSRSPARQPVRAADRQYIDPQPGDPTYFRQPFWRSRSGSRDRRRRRTSGDKDH